MQPSQIDLCPCQSRSTYDVCCESYHTGQQAPTAEVLMRSRYSAFALAKVDYLINTTHREHPQYRKDVIPWRKELEAYCEMTEFLGLTVLKHVPVVKGDKRRSTVTFEATLSQGGKPFVLKETSLFYKAGARWLYHSGTTQTAPVS